MERLKADPERYEQYRQNQKTYIAAWDKANKDKRAAYAKKFREAHLEEIRAKEREAARKYKEMYPERIKAATKRRTQRMMASPTAYQKHLEDQRIYRRLRLEREQGRDLNSHRNLPCKYSYDRDKLVPIKPLADWLVPVMAERCLTAAEIAKMCEIDPTGFARVVGRRKNLMYLSVADKVLTELSGPPLRSLYPDA
jgi:hypothetical protein